MDGRVFVQFVDFQDIFTDGETMGDAAFLAADALSAMLAVKMENGIKSPPQAWHTKRGIHRARRKNTGSVA